MPLVAAMGIEIGPGWPNDLSGQQSVVDAFLAASRSGDLDALLALLDPDVLLHADPAAVRMGSPREVHGAAAVLSGRALAARPALVDGLVGVTWAPGERDGVVWDITTVGQTIVGIDMVADTDSLDELDLVILG